MVNRRVALKNQNKLLQANASYRFNSDSFGRHSKLDAGNKFVQLNQLKDGKAKKA